VSVGHTVTQGDKVEASLSLADWPLRTSRAAYDHEHGFLYTSRVLFTAPSSIFHSRLSYLYGLPRKEPIFPTALGSELRLIRRRTSLLLAPLTLAFTPWWNYQPFPVSPLTFVENCVAEPHLLAILNSGRPIQDVIPPSDRYSGKCC
jgi:hypothetical protein